MTWKYSQFFKRRIVREYLAGAEIRTLADRHKITPQAVRSIVERAGVLRPSMPAKQRIVELIQSGLPVAEIARDAGVSESRVRQVRRECGLTAFRRPAERVAYAVQKLAAIRAERRAQ